MERSATIFGINSTLWKAIGTNPLQFGIFTTRGTQIATQCFEALGEAKFKKNYSRGRAMSKEDAVRFILREAVPAGSVGRGPAHHSRGRGGRVDRGRHDQ